jgi:hypothetical protein
MDQPFPKAISPLARAEFALPSSNHYMQRSKRRIRAQTPPIRQSTYEPS